ncbi:methylenetetrahydrofolate reductase [NAD(P)H] [Fusobacterium sp. IOR10]|uniref:methylenetetrahydrofolate reductase [NAD(P)H] n=1 Tax=Fusobacterium sp. IOR10 TaxID=2665157 RepID=UPI0013CFE06C|nr:methylenetetrahydrofolate reductase [NAD(P)H] [Fusobacterium sp. IOR10]
MKIKEIFEKKKTTISFEVFPPNKYYSLEEVYSVIDKLSELGPDFISVTYGANGSGMRKTAEIAEKIQSKNICSLAHLTCIGASKKEIEHVLKDFEKYNIENILALRGDPPKEYLNLDKGDFKYASDLVDFLKLKDKYCIGGAVYSETHQENNDLLDLFNLKKKVESGTDFLISQMFFDNNNFFEFLEKLKKLEINIPVIAGIIPITNSKQIKKITSLCGAKIPPKLQRILDKYEDNPEALKEAGIGYATEQIIELIASDVKGVHIYTMNKPEIAKKIMENIARIRETF